MQQCWVGTDGLYDQSVDTHAVVPADTHVAVLADIHLATVVH